MDVDEMRVDVHEENTLVVLEALYNEALRDGLENLGRPRILIGRPGEAKVVYRSGLRSLAP